MHVVSGLSEGDDVSLKCYQKVWPVQKFKDSFWLSLHNLSVQNSGVKISIPSPHEFKQREEQIQRAPSCPSNSALCHILLTVLREQAPAVQSARSNQGTCWENGG